MSAVTPGCAANTAPVLDAPARPPPPTIYQPPSFPAPLPSSLGTVAGGDGVDGGAVLGGEGEGVRSRRDGPVDEVEPQHLWGEGKG